MSTDQAQPPPPGGDGPRAEEPLTHDDLNRLFADPKGLWGQLTGVQNDKLGKRLLLTGFFFLLLGGSFDSILIRLQRAIPTNDLVSPELYNELFTNHGTVVMFLAPVSTLVRGAPAPVREASVRWRRRLRLRRRGLRPVRHPVAVWLLAVGALWFWHAAVPYDAAVENHVFHVVEHASFVATGVLFWWVVIGARDTDRVPHGFAILLVFAMAMQSVFLSALLTFAGTPWYSAYATTTSPWGLDPLADQQLAGVIMWIPAGLGYVGAGLGLLVAWIRASERQGLAV